MESIRHITTRLDRRRLVIIAAAVAAAMMAYLLMPANMNELARRMVAIFVIATIFWATEIIPLYATSLCLVALQVLLLASDGGFVPAGAGPGGVNLNFHVFFAPFASPVIILFMGGFLLAAAVSKHGLDQAIASRVLQPFTRSPLTLLYGVMGVTAFFGLWVSNTATPDNSCCSRSRSISYNRFMSR